MSRFPSPAPLPSLPTAFSRRAALFGAVLSTGALVGSVANGQQGGQAAPPVVMPQQARELPSPLDDAALIAWADELPDLDISLTGLFGRAPDYRDDAGIDALCCRWSAIVRNIERTPAQGPKGIAAKARAVRHLVSMRDDEMVSAISASLAADVLRLTGEAA